MTLAVILVVVAVLSLAGILRITVTRSLRISRSSTLAGQIQPIDVEAFRNLVDPAEDHYLRRRLPSAKFRMVRRERLRAMAAYVKTAGRNASVLALIGQSALASTDAHTAEAARQLVDHSLLLRRNAAFALLKINVALAWPHSGTSGAPVLDGYEQLSSSAMLLGRLQNPATPVRISSSR